MTWVIEVNEIKIGFFKEEKDCRDAFRRYIRFGLIKQIGDLS